MYMYMYMCIQNALCGHFFVFDPELCVRKMMLFGV